MYIGYRMSFLNYLIFGGTIYVVFANCERSMGMGEEYFLELSLYLLKYCLSNLKELFYMVAIKINQTNSTNSTNSTNPNKLYRT